MNRRTGIALLVLVAILIVIFLVQNRKDKKDAADNKDQAVLSIVASNQTKNQDATAVNANPNDIIVYTLNVENPTDKVISGFVAEVNIADVMELATLVDAQGANFNAGTGSLIWTPLDIPEKGILQKTFTVRVKEDLPQNSDNVMKTKFNNEVVVNVSAPAVAGDNTTAVGKGEPKNSPTTGAGTNLILILAAVTTISAFLIKRYKMKMA